MLKKLALMIAAAALSYVAYAPCASACGNIGIHRPSAKKKADDKKKSKKKVVKKKSKKGQEKAPAKDEKKKKDEADSNEVSRR